MLISIPKSNIEFKGSLNKKPILNKFEKHLNKIIPGVIFGVWGIQTKLDIANAIEEDKKNVFINNIILGVAMVTGGLLGNFGVKKFCTSQKSIELIKTIKNNAFIKKTFKIIPEYIKNYPTKDFFQAFSIPAGAGIAGGVAGEIAQKKFPVKEDKSKEILEKAGFFADLDYGTMSKMYSYSNVGLVESFDNNFSTLIGYSVGKEQGVKNKIERFVYEIISGVIVPLAIILPLNIKLKKQVKDPKLRGAIILGTGISASLIGKSFAQWFNNKVTENVIENQLWEKISQKQHELTKDSVFTYNSFEKQKLLSEIQKLKEVKDKIKNPNQ